MTAFEPKSSIVLLKTQPLFDPSPQIQMPSIGDIEPFAEPPDQGIGVNGPSGNEIGGGEIQMDLDFGDPADRIGRIHSGKLQTAVFGIAERHVQPQVLIAESQRGIELGAEIHRIGDKIA